MKFVTLYESLLAVSYTHLDVYKRQILDGRDSRLMLIIGPCSADREDSVMDYVCRLVPLQEKVKDKILIVPRIYTNKPRTNGSGYKGMLHQPDPSKKPDMLEGIIAIRRLHTRAVQELSLIHISSERGAKAGAP